MEDNMGLPVEECHFGWFNEEELEKALSILKNYIKE